MILRRYMIRQVMTTTALVLGFLVLILLGGRLIRYFGLAAKGGLQIQFLFRLIGYNLPSFLELILPIAFFIALMLTFGRLYADNEMAIFNASGISSFDLAWLLMPLLVVLFVLEAFLALNLKPWGVRLADRVWQEQSLAQVFNLVRPREFVGSGRFWLYVGDISKDKNRLSDVILIESPPKGSTTDKNTLIVAKQAAQVVGADNTAQLDLYDGKRYEFSTQSQAYNEIGFGRYRITLDVKDTPFAPARIKSFTTQQLLDNPSPQTLAELSHRLAMPWLIIIAMAMALPFSKVSPRQGRWLKLVPAVLVYVMTSLLVILLKELIEKQRVGVWGYPALLVAILMVCLYAHHHTRIMMAYRIKGQPL